PDGAVDRLRRGDADADPAGGPTHARGRLRRRDLLHGREPAHPPRRRPHAHGRVVRASVGARAAPRVALRFALAGLWEAEVDLAGGWVGPAAGDDLAAGVELDRLGPVRVQVAEQRVLPAAEAVVGDGDRDRDVDTDHARGG